MKIALCSIGTEVRGGGRTIGLVFLSYLISRQRRGVEQFWVPAKDVHRLTPRDCDVLLISLLSVLAVPTLIRALRGGRPQVRTIIGGPGAIVCGGLRHFVDAVIVGRGEDAIFRALDGDYSGMAVPGPTMPDGSVEIFRPSLLSWDLPSCGCGIKCNFCTYAWMNMFARQQGDCATGYTVSSTNPNAEKLLVHVTADDLRRAPPPPKQIVAGLDGLNARDLYMVRKAISWSRLRSWVANLGQAFGPKERLSRVIRLYVIVNYPWQSPEDTIEECYDLQRLCIETRKYFPPEIKILCSVGMQPFIPSLFTPLEREPVMLSNPRAHLSGVAPCGFFRPRGLRLDVNRYTCPSHLGAMVESILGRTEDPDVFVDVAQHMDIAYLEGKYEHLLGRIAWRPQPWVRRINDTSYREYAYYRDLHRLGLIDADTFIRMVPHKPLRTKINSDPIYVPMLQERPAGQQTSLNIV